MDGPTGLPGLRVYELIARQIEMPDSAADADSGRGIRDGGSMEYSYWFSAIAYSCSLSPFPCVTLTLNR